LIFADHRTIEVALAFNSIRASPQSKGAEGNGMAEAFVKTFERDCPGSAQYRMPTRLGL